MGRKEVENFVMIGAGVIFGILLVEVIRDIVRSPYVSNVRKNYQEYLAEKRAIFTTSSKLLNQVFPDKTPNL